METLVTHDMPILKDPVLILGFSGWPNAGEVSTGTLAYLIEKLDAMRFAELLPESYYDLTSDRPTAVIEMGEIKTLVFPSNEFFYWKSPSGTTDLILFLGKEPHMHWTSYVHCILDLAEQLDVKELCTIGGTYDNVAHSSEPKISALVSQESLIGRLDGHNLGLSEYQGPISIHTRLLMSALERNIPAMSLWGHAPYYVQVKNIKVCHRILLRLSRLFQFNIDLEEIKRMSDLMDEQIERAIQKNPELREYIKNLEHTHQESSRVEKTPSPGGKDNAKAEGDKIIRFEAFLKKYPEGDE